MPLPALTGLPRLYLYNSAKPANRYTAEYEEALTRTPIETGLLLSPDLARMSIRSDVCPGSLLPSLIWLSCLEFRIKGKSTTSPERWVFIQSVWIYSSNYGRVSWN